MTEAVNKRVVVHFPGFERMDAHAHHNRFRRTAQYAARLWGFSADTGPLQTSEGRSDFTVVSKAAQWQTLSRIYICDHNVLVEKLGNRSTLRRMVSGFSSAGFVVVQGGLLGYFRNAWRFGLFFVFPFLLMAIVLTISLALAIAPAWLGLGAWHYLWSLPLSIVLFRFLLLPFCERYLTLHLFDDWALAVAVARLNAPDLTDWLGRCADTMLHALEEDADEYLISSHSMGSSLATQVLGMVLERKPDALSGKRVAFVTLGGAILQCALLKPATRLRARVEAIATAEQVTWLEIQCLTDIIHFYKCRVVAASGYPDAPQADIMSIRVKRLLLPERYRKIKRDFLRVHRQYVLHADLQGEFDFTVLTTGPFPAHLASDYSKRSFVELQERDVGGTSPSL